MQDNMTLIYRAYKGCLIDIWEQFFIKNVNEHKLIQEQVPGEIGPLFTLLFGAQQRYAIT
jgi:hypothetical protein